MRATLTPAFLCVCCLWWSPCCAYRKHVANVDLLEVGSTKGPSFDFFVIGYPLFKVTGVQFFHSAVVICDRAKRVANGIPHGFFDQISGKVLHAKLRQAQCTEIGYGAKADGSGAVFIMNPDRIALYKPATVEWRFAGGVRGLPQEQDTSLAVAENLKRIYSADESFAVYHLITNNCNSFTTAVLQHFNTDEPEEVLSPEPGEGVTIAPENMYLNPGSPYAYTANAIEGIIESVMAKDKARLREIEEEAAK